MIIIKGLGPNLYNTCYINSVLQCFCHLVLNGHELFSALSEVEDPKLKDLYDTLKMFISLHSKRKNSSNDYNNLLRLVWGNPNFSMGVQSDAAEFLKWLLDLNGGIGPFIGTYETFYKCSFCSNLKDRKFEHNSIAMFQVANCTSLVESYEQFVGYESDPWPIDGLTCGRCHSNDWQYIQIPRKLPEIMIINLKRFAYDKDHVIKLMNYMTIPMEIDMEENNIQIGKSTVKYSLLSICFHIGNEASSGHYTSNI